MTAKGDYFPPRVNLRVPNMAYAADVVAGGFGKIKIPAMVALDADGIIAAQSIAAAGNTSTFATTYASSKMGKFGRNVTVVASGTAVTTVTVTGRDYLGQKMVEVLTLNGATPVLGVKAFKHITNVAWALTAARTIDVGWGNVLGLPYKLLDVYTELVSDAETSDAGTFVKGVDTAQTATSTDPRGTYSLHANNVNDGTKYYELVGLWDDNNLHGVAHYAG